MMLEFLYKGFYTVPDITVLTGATTESTQQPPAKLPRTRDEAEDNSCAPGMTSPHPSYIHPRMYRLADYFMIDSLKEMAKRQFVEALNSQSNWFPSCGIEQVIVEIYTTRGNYEELKAPLIKIIERWLDKNHPQVKSYIRSVITSLNSISAFENDLMVEILLESDQRDQQT